MNGAGRALAALATAMWSGALVAVGFLVAPKLFAVLRDSTVAGDLAGALFAQMAWVSFIGCALLLLYFFFLRPGGWGWGWLCTIALCTTLNHLWLRPVIIALRKSHAPSSSFAFWHGFSSLLYMAALVAVIVLSIRLIRPLP
jgi:hypothetical protein